MSEWLTVREAAERLNLTEESIRRMVRAGTLPAQRRSGGSRAPLLIREDAARRRAAVISEFRGSEVGSESGAVGVESHVTYIRDADRTRVVFVFDCDWEEASRRARSRAPVGFRFAAVHEHAGGEFRVPMDGDDYGASGVPVVGSQVK